MSFLSKIVTILIFIMLMAISYIYIKKSIKYNYKEPNIEQIMQTKLSNGYLDKEIKRAIKEKRYSDIEIFTKLADRFGIKLQNSTKELIDKENTTTKKITRGVRNFLKGFLSGKSHNSIETAGAIASDFTIYGDLRDVNTEGQKYITNQPYDKMILGLSMAGLALSATQIVTFGGSSTLKVAASSLKLAKRDKVLTKEFSNILSQKLNEAINYKALKGIKYGSINEIKESIKTIKNSVNLKPIKPILKEYRNLQKNTSFSDSIALLKYVDNTQDLKAVAKLSKRYKGATLGIFKIMGKNAFRLVKAGIKWSKDLIIGIAGLILSLIGFLFSFKYLVKIKHK